MNLQSLKKRVKSRLLKARIFYLSVRNWSKGLAFSPVSRCRNCEHTVYAADRRGALCRYCA